MPCEPAAQISPIARRARPAMSIAIVAAPPPDRAPMTTSASPEIVPSHPTTKSAGAARPSMVKVEAPGRVGPGVPVGSAGETGSGTWAGTSGAARSGATGSWRSGPPGSEPGGINARGSGPGREPSAPWRSCPSARAGPTGGPARRRWPCSQGTRAVASRRLVVGSRTAAAATSRRSKSLPHQAHSDQSIPTRRLQLGQTRLSRVRQLGQMIHSSLIVRSQPGQWWIDSTSASSASSARFRSQTSPIFSCGRMIL